MLLETTGTKHFRYMNIKHPLKPWFMNTPVNFYGYIINEHSCYFFRSTSFVRRTVKMPRTISTTIIKGQSHLSEINFGAVWFLPATFSKYTYYLFWFLFSYHIHYMKRRIITIVDFYMPVSVIKYWQVKTK